ncbi:MAG: hypothetical protein IJG63_01880, partial [Oscillospiraceae bacterium]|nr:hypothetical protein [Oscillospiraceae bacterium]
MHSFIAVIIGLVFALAATVLLYIFVMPKSKEGCLPAFFQTLRDFFNFKTLYLEFIIKVVYTFSTLACIFMGFFLLFAHDYYSSTALQGLLIMILGPIVLRITYELLIMTVLLVKNVMEINGKLRGTARKEVRQPVMRYCTMCGTRYDITAGRCPVCGGKGKPRHKRPTPPDVIYSPPPAETPETAYEPAPDTAPDPEPAPDVTPEASPDA